MPKTSLQIDHNALFVVVYTQCQSVSRPDFILIVPDDSTCQGCCCTSTGSRIVLNKDDNSYFRGIPSGISGKPDMGFRARCILGCPGLAIDSATRNSCSDTCSSALIYTSVDTFLDEFQCFG